MGVRGGLPQVGGSSVIAAAKTLFWVAGGVVDVAVGYAERGTPLRSAALLSMGVLALAFAALTRLLGTRMPPWGRHALFVVATVFCTLTVLAVPRPLAALALAGGFAFVITDALVFYPLRQAITYVTVAVASCSAALLVRADVPWPDVLVHGIVLLAPMVIIANLVRRAANAHQDPLTGLANRRAFDDTLDTTLLEVARTGGAVSVAMIDLDHFKDVNDTAGHSAGDQLLQRLADSWSRQLPPSVHAARLGGDEFALILPGYDGPGAFDLVDSLRHVAISTLGIGLSCALAQARPRESPTELLRRIDVVLYQAKAAGRGRCLLIHDEHEQLAAELSSALLEAKALLDAAGGPVKSRSGSPAGTPTAAPALPGAELAQLQVHYQPIMDMVAGEVVGLEALLRWTHPVLGPQEPEAFVALAETEGVIGDLGAFVLARACRDAHAVQDAAGRRLFLTVNVSGAELTCEHYPDLLAETLQASGWPAAQLVLEVTESLIDADSAPALRALRRLRRLGVGVAIDDFGTGYSSLSRLDTLPASHLKLDHAFVATVTTSPSRARLVGAVVTLSRAFDLHLVAEGIETADQADALVRLGARLGQGFHYHRPQPLAGLLTTVTGSLRSHDEHSQA
ncbi:putative bifunctional diguanylate cyclase/phosphodiesterase [Kineococcus rubinsiae]|uniref:putative bifunctional diguanylate cyclase/phosphodiesterase n=1 Tax=Kineococcus rubinsiae TaxID=2609562 RepID=UPI0014308AD5|nr:EAL domain-containing protein [Kineococcus rubinsiae]NIZ90357.1 EAL domain-containing protein [Kineococcus rubinsiae]